MRSWTRSTGNNCSPAVSFDAGLRVTRGWTLGWQLDETARGPCLISRYDRTSRVSTFTKSAASDLSGFLSRKAYHTLHLFVLRFYL